MNHFKHLIKAVPLCAGTLLLGHLAQTQSKPALSPNASVHPIVDVARGYFLGGSARGQWLQSAVAARSVSSQQPYRVYGLKGLIGPGTGSKPATEGAPCETTLFSHLKSGSKTIAVDDHAIALSGDWNPQPRRAQLLKTSNATYRRVVADMLRQHGLRSPVKITQLMRVDLDGDGEPEVLITAKRSARYQASSDSIGSRSQAGDYAFVLLRRFLRGKLQTQLIESEFHKTPDMVPNFFRILNVLDLNGDGKMEIVLRGQYYEGDWTSVYSEANGKFKEALSVGCGA